MNQGQAGSENLKQAIDILYFLRRGWVVWIKKRQTKASVDLKTQSQALRAIVIQVSRFFLKNFYRAATRLNK